MNSRWLTLALPLLLELTPASVVTAAEPVAVIDINTATAEQLQTLPGIGTKKAEDIVRYRASRPFKKTTDIMRIRGIGQKLYARLRNLIGVGGTSTPATPAK